MPLETYIPKTFAPKAWAIIEQANVIIAEYQKQGFTLSLRQLYYQFVSRDLLPNEVKYYRLLGNCVNDGRLAGKIDWLAIEDRDRNVVRNSHWDEPSDIMHGAAHSYALDKWADQPYHVEVWIEKKALEGVIDPVCRELDVPYFACKGYTSQSEQWRAGRRFRAALRSGQQVIVFHLGDHDPSGIDMTRDN